GKLEIRDDLDNQHDITNLAGLAGLTSVSGFLDIMFNNLLTNTIYLNLVSIGGARISSNAALTTINGLPLTSIPQGLTIENNASLTSITAFASVTSIGVQLNIQSNPLLTNFSGFANLTSVTGSLILGNNNSMANVNGFSKLESSNVLSVRNNPALANINGLSSLEVVGQLNILNNAVLASIDGLSKLTTVNNSIEIANNPLIQNVSGLSNLQLTTPASIYIHHNNSLQSIVGPGLATRIGVLRIETNPALTSISGFSALKSSSGIEIVDNDALETISGFDALDTIFGNYELLQNNVLTTVNAFSKVVFIRNNYININNYILQNITPMTYLDSIGGYFDFRLDTLLTNFDFIPNIRGIRRNVRILGNTRLENFNGFAHIRSVGDLLISGSPKVTSISPLSGITEIGGSLLISSMSGLLSLDGLQNIRKVGIDLHVVANGKLTSLNQLVSIDSVGRELVISLNPLITNLNGLRNLRKTDLVYVATNPMLAEFCGLYTLYANGGPSTATMILQNFVNPTPAQILAAGACTSVALPVTLKAFNTKCERNKATVNWITAREYNNSHFVLQRSPNGTAWTNLGIIQAATNSGGENKYSFSDESPLANGFYRLAQYDKDGKVHYSSILKFGCNIQNDFTLHPNPASDKVVVNIQSVNTAQLQLRIFDSKGTLVRTKSLILLPGLTQFEIDIKGLASGAYLLEVRSTSGTLQKNKVFLKK
ncbi:MAG TPA: T9SS type A sorting domain-containing protein, partial [Flavitalea sp.]|nr:T9SS type A sorting domain-containing protein [Flavitalea sp.]